MKHHFKHFYMWISNGVLTCSSAALFGDRCMTAANNFIKHSVIIYLSINGMVTPVSHANSSNSTLFC